jgi:hypothetical protein
MNRVGLLAVIFIFSCRGDANVENEDPSVFNYGSFSERFREVKLPYELSDTALLKNKDTGAIRNAVFLSYISDSLKKSLFGNKANPRFIPLARMKKNEGESYFLVKAVNARKITALLLAFDADNNFSAAFPFLIPDNDNRTNQISVLDRSFSVSRTVSRRMPDDVTVDGRDVYVYDPAEKKFMLIMTDVLDESNVEVVNPIDTFSATRKMTGDYIRDKRNFVSIRDGKNENEISFFVHFEKDGGDCTGEIKGSALFTSSTVAVFRQGPCTLQLRFGTNSVQLEEEGGCGTYRGVKCVFDGTYRRKKGSGTSKPSGAKTGR